MVGFHDGGCGGVRAKTEEQGNGQEQIIVEAKEGRGREDRALI